MPIRQAVMESLKCFDSEVLDEIDDYNPNKIDSYSVVIEWVCLFILHFILLFSKLRDGA